MPQNPLPLLSKLETILKSGEPFLR